MGKTARCIENTGGFSILQSKIVFFLLAYLWIIGLGPLGDLTFGDERPLTAGDYDLSLQHGSRARTYLLHVPPRAQGGNPLPLVLVFHGGGGKAQGQKEWAGLDAVGDRAGFLAVYPDGTGLFSRRLLTWNAGGCCGYAMRNKVDDVGFVVALLKDVARRTQVDRTRVYATGMSNGAMMSYRLAVEIPERIAAIAPVAGAMMVESFASALAMPVLHFHSVDDTRALYGGGAGPLLPFLRRVSHPPVEDTITRWVRHDGCAAEPQVGSTLHGITEGLDTSHTAAKIVHGGCRDGVEVVLWKLTGAGHVWPGAGPKYAEWLLGAPTRVVNASEEMWTFFQRFSRPDAPPLQ
jgi:polyhydroxybutyrate depolymerase